MVVENISYTNRLYFSFRLHFIEKYSIDTGSPVIPKNHNRPEQ